jgi:hypothetical protein
VESIISNQHVTQNSFVSEIGVHLVPPDNTADLPCAPGTAKKFVADLDGAWPLRLRPLCAPRFS